MGVTDTLEFVLSCYDFDGTGRLTIDEVSLAFKSTVTGMCKLEGAGGAGGAGPGLKACPRDVDFEAAAMNAFERRAEESDRFKVKVHSQSTDHRGVPAFQFSAGHVHGYNNSHLSNNLVGSRCTSGTAAVRRTHPRKPWASNVGYNAQPDALAARRARGAHIACCSHITN